MGDTLIVNGGRKEEKERRGEKCWNDKGWLFIEARETAWRGEVNSEQAVLVEWSTRLS